MLFADIGMSPGLPRMRRIVEFNSRNDTGVGIQDQEIERELVEAIQDRLRAAAALEIENL